MHYNTIFSQLFQFIPRHRFEKSVETNGANLERILSRKPRTLDELNEAWFGRRQTSFAHYDDHRYRSLNLNPVWEPKHTVEWRFYENKDVMGTRTETSTDCFPKVPIIFIGSPARREYGKTSDFAFRAQKSYRFSRNLSLSREG